MFERFTDRARRVVVLAQEEARLLNHGYIGTEHLLLGLLHEGEGVAAKALVALGVDLEGVRGSVEAIIGAGGEVPSGHIPFTPRAKKVLELSLREALQLGHNYIGTEHILLGLVREGEGVAAQVLANQGVTLPRVREQVMEQLGVRAPRGGPPRVTPPASFTPAGQAVVERARRLAEGRPVGTHHLLRALWDEEEGLARRALAGAGIDATALASHLDDLDPAGTGDELPEDAGARRTSIQLVGDKVAVLLEDSALRERVAAVMERAGRELRSRTADPAGTVFPRLWRSVHDAVGEVVARAERKPGEGPPPDWRPPEWPESPDVAAFAVVAGTNLHTILEVAEGVDRADVRAGLAAWLTEHQPRGPEAHAEHSYLSLAVERAEEPGDWGRVVGFSGHSLPGWPTRSMDLLVAHAIVDLSVEQLAGEPGEPGGPPPGAEGSP